MLVSEIESFFQDLLTMSEKQRDQSSPSTGGKKNAVYSYIRCKECQTAGKIILQLGLQLLDQQLACAEAPLSLNISECELCVGLFECRLDMMRRAHLLTQTVSSASLFDSSSVLYFEQD